METRIGIGTDGKSHSFKVNDKYYPPYSNTNGLFSKFKKCACCVLYTELKDDYGEVENPAIPCLIPYNNGVVGYQSYNFYDTIEEGKEELKKYSKLSPKMGTIAYVDVWLAINDNK